MSARRAPDQLLLSFWVVASVMLRGATLIGVALLLILVVLPAAIGAVAP